MSGNEMKSAGPHRAMKGFKTISFPLQERESYALLSDAAGFFVESNTPPQAAGHLTLAAVAKCLQAVTLANARLAWHFARGNENI